MKYSPVVDSVPYCGRYGKDHDTTHQREGTCCACTLEARPTSDIGRWQRLAAQGFDPGGTAPEPFAGIIRRDLARGRKVIANATIRAE